MKVLPQRWTENTARVRQNHVSSWSHVLKPIKGVVENTLRNMQMRLICIIGGGVCK